MAPTVAIIIPVLNERKVVGEALLKVLDLGADEIIVVDGNSTDGTYEFIREYFPQVKCLKSQLANRSIQMNEGAHEAVSDILVFVHADLRLPESSIDLMKKSIQEGFVGGGHLKHYVPDGFLLNIYGFLINNIYTRLLKNLVGSNAIFVKRDVFMALKGFSNVEFMEDVIFSRDMKRKGRISIINDCILVSSRRYLERGILRQIIRNVNVMINYFFFHKNPKELKQLYMVNCYEC